MSTDPVNPRTRDLAHESLAADDPTGWFEQLYAEASEGRAEIPWDRGIAHAQLTDWVETARPDGTGKKAVVVGAGTGWDAELVADRGFVTTAFDISPTAIETAKQNHPGSKVNYLTADLFNLPPDWRRAFDLVVEIYTVQALPIPLQPSATEQISDLLAPGGTLLVIAVAREDDVPDSTIEGPPWPLKRAAIDAFEADDLKLVDLGRSPSPVDPSVYRWRAEYRRDSGE
ncbi:methyltransferase domain-containing protein [Kribbella yunnanensis]|uniref:Methyltransferase domain-containing protein n=1 Tax=Kribbella yunnanensis TaxID=190194 RepID=A0ABN2GTG2_9ACTN